MNDRLLAKDLYEYLIQLQETLKQRGSLSLSDKVRFAGRFVSGSTTELYMESEEALKLVLSEHNGVLSEQETADLRQKIAAIDAEFRLIGGA